MLHDPAFLLANLRAPLSVEAPEAKLAARLWLRIPLALVLCALTLRAMARASKDQSLVLGAGLVFALIAPSSYYWIILLLVPVVSGERGALVLIGIWTALYALTLAFPGSPYIDFRFAVLSWVLLFAALAWTVDVVRARPAPR